MKRDYGFVFFLILLYFYSMCMNVSCMYVCTTCMSGAHVGQKRTSDLQKLELHIVMNSHVGSHSLSHLSSPEFFFIK